MACPFVGWKCEDRKMIKEKSTFVSFAFQHVTKKCEFKSKARWSDFMKTKADILNGINLHSIKEQQMKKGLKLHPFAACICNQPVSRTYISRLRDVKRKKEICTAADGFYSRNGFYGKFIAIIYVVIYWAADKTMTLLSLFAQKKTFSFLPPFSASVGAHQLQIHFHVIA